MSHALSFTFAPEGGQIAPSLLFQDVSFFTQTVHGSTESPTWRSLGSSSRIGKWRRSQATALFNKKWRLRKREWPIFG